MVTRGWGTWPRASRTRIPRPPQKSTTFILILQNCCSAATSDGDGCAPPKGRIQTVVALKRLDSREPHVVREHLARQANALEALAQLLDTTSHGPFRPKSWQHR